MRLFTDSRGITLSFGFNMLERKPEPGIVCWQIAGGDWQWLYPLDHIVIDPEFIFERNGIIAAYQPGLLVEMTYVGHPIDFAIRYLRP